MSGVPDMFLVCLIMISIETNEREISGLHNI